MPTLNRGRVGDHRITVTGSTERARRAVIGRYRLAAGATAEHMVNGEVRHGTQSAQTHIY